MAEEILTCKEHEDFHREYAHRVDAEDERQNARITLLEDATKQITALTVSMERISVNMENVLAEIKGIDGRLKKLEDEPAENQKQIKQAIVTAIIGTVVGAVVTAVLMLL